MAWWVGCIINIFGSISINLGTNVMKLGHNLRESSAAHEADRKSIRSFKEWRMGVTIFVMGNVANFLSFGFAAQSLLASLGTIQFVSNVCFARFVLQEEVTYRVLLATACIVGGCIVLVAFGNHESADYGVQDMIDLYTRTQYVVYLVVLMVMVVLCYLTYRGTKKAVQEQRVGSKRARYGNTLLPMLYSVFSAMLGTQSVLMAKTLSQLLRTVMKGDAGALSSWFTYIILVCFITSAAFWATRLNKSLQLFPALIIVPLMQINWTLFSIVSGGMYFKEFEEFSADQAVLFVLGVLIVLAGVILLSWNPQRPPRMPTSYGNMDMDEDDLELETSNHSPSAVRTHGWSASSDNLLATQDANLATLTATTDDPSLMIPARVAAPSLPFPPLFAGSELAGSELGSDSAGRATYPSAINPLERAGSDTVRHANPLFDSYPQPGDVEHGDRLSSLNSALSHGPTPASDVLGGALAFAMEVGRRGVQNAGTHIKDEEAAADWGIDWEVARNQVGLGMPTGDAGPFMSVFGSGVVVTPATSSCGGYISGGTTPRHSGTTPARATTSVDGTSAINAAVVVHGASARVGPGESGSGGEGRELELFPPQSKVQKTPSGKIAVLRATRDSGAGGEGAGVGGATAGEAGSEWDSVELSEVSEIEEVQKDLQKAQESMAARLQARLAALPTTMSTTTDDTESITGFASAPSTLLGGAEADDAVMLQSDDDSDHC